MDIHVLFDGIMKSINRFAGEIAEQWLQEKTQESGPDLEIRGKNAEEFDAKEKRKMTSIPKGDYRGCSANTLKEAQGADNAKNKPRSPTCVVSGRGCLF